VPLKDISIQDITVILNNLSFLALVEPFQMNGVSGKAISRMKSHQNIISIGKGQIEEFVAETFFEDFVVEWKATGLVPKGLLQPKVSLKLSICYEVIITHCSFCRSSLHRKAIHHRRLTQSRFFHRRRYRTINSVLKFLFTG
jgi:hypothetical protein